jgi:hypothetical protein
LILVHLHYDCAFQGKSFGFRVGNGRLPWGHGVTNFSLVLVMVRVPILADGILAFNVIRITGTSKSTGTSIIIGCRELEFGG